MTDTGTDVFRDANDEIAAVLPSVGAYLSVIADTARPVRLTLQGLSGAERADGRTDVQDAFARFRAVDGYERVALCAVGS